MLNRLQQFYRSNRNAVFKYLIIGIGAVIADNGMFFIVYKVYDGPLLLATILALSIGFCISFFGNKLWVFKTKEQESAHPPVKQLIFYTVLFIFNITFTFHFINIMEKLAINAIIAKLLTTILITSWNYILYKKVIFRLR